jgi:hypothetical protein
MTQLLVGVPFLTSFMFETQLSGLSAHSMQRQIGKNFIKYLELNLVINFAILVT